MNSNNDQLEQSTFDVLTTLGHGKFREETYKALYKLSPSLAFDYANTCIMATIYWKNAYMADIGSEKRASDIQMLISLHRIIDKYTRLVHQSHYDDLPLTDEMLAMAHELERISISANP